MFECVINIAEGRDLAKVATFSVAAGSSLRDTHSDADHHRSVFTLINDAEPLQHDVRELVASAFTHLDLRNHVGVHPRLGVVDVVPYVALATAQANDAVALRDDTAQWMAHEFAVPIFVYGPLGGGKSRSLPDIRRTAFRSLPPDAGPAAIHPRYGASALGARPILVAWNLWLHGVSLATTQAVAKSIRSPAVRALGLPVGSFTQVSCNLIDVTATRPSVLFDRVCELLPAHGRVARAEVVGLVPRSLLEQEDSRRWSELGLMADATIEARLGR
jgi:glutamate formiminotransferase / 5-formyltetrahydrofolate cyclo-ligase